MTLRVRHEWAMAAHIGRIGIHRRSPRAILA
jgi:hypothetical protein